jgi:hypothetical protein
MGSEVNAMKRIALFLAAPLVLGAAAYHDWPQDYEQARNVASTSLELDANSVISISHNALHWRQGIFDAIKSGGTKQFFDPYTWYRKFGNAVVRSAVELGGVAIPAGFYEISLKVPGDDPAKMFIEFKAGDSTHDVPFQMVAMTGAGDAESGHQEEDHLFLGLSPRGGAGSMDFELMVLYGDHAARVAGSFTN